MLKVECDIGEGKKIPKPGFRKNDLWLEKYAFL